jgi:ABC-type Fe3+ transport system permease subunit
VEGAAATELMTLFELLFLVVALILSFLFSRFFYRFVSWWAIFPGIVLGFGMVWVFLFTLHKAWRLKRQNRHDNSS